MIEAVIFSQGDELTTGQIVDTNSAWIARELWAAGVVVRQMVTIPDHLGDLTAAFSAAAARAPVVICTGGLGPTSDDLTAEAVAAALGSALVERPEALAQIEARYRAWDREMRPVNRKQALLPPAAAVLENTRGTAPGFAVELGGSVVYCLPGVPHEMREMIRAAVMPDLQQRFALAPAVMRQIGVVMPESHMADALSAVDLRGAEVGFRADVAGNLVKLRFPPGTPAAVADAAQQAARAALGDAVFSDGEPDVAVVVSEQLRARGETVAVAESCTGGQLCARLVAIPGASRWVLEGAVLYANAAKIRTCGVSPELIEAHGAVSEPVARQLAAGIRARAGADWGVGITGVAGPGGGRPGKPVGTVHMAIAGPDGEVAHRRSRVPGDRTQVTARSVTAALLFLHRQLCRVGSGTVPGR